MAILTNSGRAAAAGAAQIQEFGRWLGAYCLWT